MSSTGVASEQPESSNIARLLRDSTAEHPGRPALVDADGRARFTFAELTERVARVAAELVGRDLEPGGRVALLVRDREEALIPAMAALWAGGTLVTPPRAGTWRVVLTAAARDRPAAVVADPSTWLLAAVVHGLRSAPIRIVTGRRSWPGLVGLVDLASRVGHDGPPALDEPVPRSANSPAFVSWTTGTTGLPRAVVRTHGVLAAQHAAIRALRAPRPGDVDLAGLPNIALHDLACGVAILVPPRADAGRGAAPLHAVAARAGVTTAAGFPTLFERLVEGAPGAALPVLRAILIGGAPVRPDLLDRLGAVAPNATVTVVYGATEVEPITAIEAADLRSSAAAGTPGRGLLVGRLCDGIELRFAPLEERTGERPASPATRGRILVRGPRVADDPDRSDADGWLDTGDVGALDADRRLWLLGRASNALPGGVLPAEIEEPVAALGDVGGAAVVSLPGGDGPRAMLAVEPASTAVASDAVRARVAALSSARGWHLDGVVVVRRLPRDGASGKVDYRRLRALVR